MAVSLEFGIGYLLTELPAHALVVLGLFEPARAVASALLESLFYDGDRLFVGVESYFHCLITPVRYLYNAVLQHMMSNPSGFAPALSAFCSGMFTSPFNIVSYYFRYLKQ